MSDEQRNLADVERLLAEACDKLGTAGTFRTRTLLSMLLLEIEKLIQDAYEKQQAYSSEGDLQ